jgi:hypothetical protein
MFEQLSIRQISLNDKLNQNMTYPCGVFVDSRCIYLMLMMSAADYFQNLWAVSGLNDLPAKRVLLMSNKTLLYSVRIGFVTAIFSAGFLCGLIVEQSANAQLGEMGQEMLKKAESSGGALGSVAQLGTAISDMEKNVNGLQHNLDTLKKVQAALGGS